MNDKLNIGKQLELIAARIKELRELLEITEEEMAERLGIDPILYKKYESCEEEIPISIIYGAANIMQVDSTLLLVGDTPKMLDYTVVRKNKGMKIERYPGYSFSSLAINYIGREMDPMIVSLKAENHPAELVSHSGQEFNYCLKGCVIVTVNDKDFELNEGDSIYFNATLPHGQRAKDTDSEFLTVINER